MKNIIQRAPIVLFGESKKINIEDQIVINNLCSKKFQKEKYQNTFEIVASEYVTHQFYSLVLELYEQDILTKEIIDQVNEKYSLLIFSSNYEIPFNYVDEKENNLEGSISIHNTIKKLERAIKLRKRVIKQTSKDGNPLANEGLIFEQPRLILHTLSLKLLQALLQENNIDEYTMPFKVSNSLDSANIECYKTIMVDDMELGGCDVQNVLIFSKSNITTPITNPPLEVVEEDIELEKIATTIELKDYERSPHLKYIIEQYPVSDEVIINMESAEQALLLELKFANDIIPNRIRKSMEIMHKKQSFEYLGDLINTHFKTEESKRPAHTLRKLCNARIHSDSDTILLDRNELKLQYINSFYSYVERFYSKGR